MSLALGAEATFVARTIDRDRKHLTEVLRAAAQHEGAALVEIYQNCPVFNDGAFAALTDKEVKDRNQIRLETGQPIRFGEDMKYGVVARPDGGLAIAEVAKVGEDGAGPPRSASRRSRVRVLAGPAGRGPAGSDADRDLPLGRAPRVRADRAGAARAGVRGGARRAAAQRGHLDGFLRG